MKFPKLDDLVFCVNKLCPNSVEAILAGESHVRLRKDGDEVIAEMICTDCAKDAKKFGIPAPLLSMLIERVEGQQQHRNEDIIAIEAHDIRHKEIMDLFEGVLYECEVPLCASVPDVATKMSSVEIGDKFVPICMKCADKAQRSGVKASGLHSIIERTAREARGAMLYELDQARQALVNKFFDQCQKQHGGTRPTSVVHQDPRDSGLGNGPRINCGG